MIRRTSGAGGPLADDEWRTLDTLSIDAWGDPRRRRRGVARSLLEATVDDRPGAVRGSVAHADTNVAIVSLLQTLGFVAVTAPIADFWTAQSRRNSAWICARCTGVCRCAATAFRLA